MAESTAALRVDGPSGVPELWFPLHEVGDRQLLSRQSDGYGTFDPSLFTVELVDPMEGAHQRDTTVKAFPVWGDASDLIAVLDVVPDADGRFTTESRGYHVRPVVEGSQMLGQAVVAAGRLYRSRRVVSGHMVFLRPADAEAPLSFALDELSDGKTFSAVSVQADQAGVRCAAGTLLLDETADELVHHQGAAPDVPGPYDCPPFDMAVTGRDIRVADGAYTGEPDAQAGPPVIDAWVRFRALPDDRDLHAGLLAQFTGHMPIAAALRPHPGIGQDQAHRSVSMAINAISISLHAEVRADRWMLYHHESTFAGDGMTHAQCAVFDEDGRRLASFVVEAMVRSFGPAAGTPDPRRVL